MPQHPITNLVFEGGSVKGAAYVGALKALEEQGVDFTAVLDEDSASCSTRNKVLRSVQEVRYGHPEHRLRTVYIDNQNIHTLQFQLTKAQRDALVHSGKEATQSYLATHYQSASALQLG